MSIRPGRTVDESRSTISRAGNVDEAGSDLDDLPAANDDGRVAQGRLAGIGDQRPGMDDGDRLGRLGRERRHKTTKRRWPPADVTS